MWVRRRRGAEAAQVAGWCGRDAPAHGVGLLVDEDGQLERGQAAQSREEMIEHGWHGEWNSTVATSPTKWFLIRP